MTLADFNARIGAASTREQSVVGEHAWERRAVHIDDTPDHDLLVEFCIGLNPLMANTFVD